MSDIKSKLKKENEFIKQLFNINGGETQFKDLFTRYITNTKKGPKYLIKLLDFYSKCRPHQQNVSKELIECIYSCFPEKKY